MSKVLIVDDEPRYRDHLCRALVRDGHDVITAGSGREAISTGSHFRPHVLVADWMLKSRLHGLHVSRALRTVVPELQTILITGFPSSDLRGYARSLEVLEFIEKPFELTHLRTAVRRVESSAPMAAEEAPVAVFEVDRTGAITFANRHALELFEQTPGGRNATDVRQVLEIDDVSALAGAGQRWERMVPAGATEPLWHVAARLHADVQTWLVVALPHERRQHRHDQAVCDLLGLEFRAHTPWPFGGRAMILDNDEHVRHAVASQIEASGGVCHTAGSMEDALRTCDRDSEIEVLVMEYEVAAEGAGEFVSELRKRWPDVRVVGTGTSDYSREFVRAGVAKFLLKPWTVRELLSLLLDRIDVCVSCGLRLPLRRPRPGEQASSWECAGCGGRYAAMLDEDSPTDALGNVRRATSQGP